MRGNKHLLSDKRAVDAHSGKQGAGKYQQTTTGQQTSQPVWGKGSQSFVSFYF